MLNLLTAAAEMPFGEVVLKSALAYVSIFAVVGVIIGVVWVLGKLGNKQEK